MTDTQPRKIRKVSTQEQIEDYEKLRQRIKNHFKDALKGKDHLCCCIILMK